MKEHHKFAFLVLGVWLANSVLPGTISNLLNPLLSVAKLNV